MREALDIWPDVHIIAGVRVVSANGPMRLFFFLGSQKNMTAQAVVEVMHKMSDSPCFVHLNFGKSTLDHTLSNMDEMRRLASNVLRRTPGLTGNLLDRQLACTLNVGALETALAQLGYISVH